MLPAIMTGGEHLLIGVAAAKYVNPQTCHDRTAAEQTTWIHCWQ